jgi:hypothetical protein
MVEGDPLDVVLVICGDEAIQGSLRALIADAGCRSVVCSSAAEAGRRVEHLRPVLVLFDPILQAECEAAVAGLCTLVAIPVRTSSTGVRRFAKRTTVAVRWLRDLVTQHCQRGP